MQIWPAVNIQSGKCVRLSHCGDRKVTVYGENPVDMADRWINDGAQCLHVVDLDAARQRETDNFEPICQIAFQTGVPIQVGGGIRDEATIEKYLEVGIKRLVVSTRALKEPDWAIEMAEKYPGSLLLGLDSREGLATSDGWTETTEISVIDYAQQMASHPFAGIIFTDIARDGMLKGPNLDEQKRLQEAVHLPVIASGGIANLDDVTNLAALELGGCVIGRALYEGRLTLADSLRAAARRGSGSRSAEPFSGATSL
jgi:phosphoribosylformimino-5-aminoimidazole carboxamide ribotide isomerase